MFHSNHAMEHYIFDRTVSEIDGDFSRKSQNFPTPCNLRPAEGVGSSLELDIGAGGSKTTMMGVYRAGK